MLLTPPAVARSSAAAITESPAAFALLATANTDCSDPKGAVRTALQLAPLSASFLHAIRAQRADRAKTTELL
jgi:hypothetical protein